MVTNSITFVEVGADPPAMIPLVEEDVAAGALGDSVKSPKSDAEPSEENVIKLITFSLDPPEFVPPENKALVAEAQPANE
jgi:hypothetical protein